MEVLEHYTEDYQTYSSVDRMSYEWHVRADAFDGIPIGDGDYTFAHTPDHATVQTEFVVPMMGSLTEYYEMYGNTHE